MPTIIMHCQPDWMPTGTNRKRLSDRPLTTFLMATWLTEKLAGIINVVDQRMGEDTALSSTTVWADFVPMSGLAINAAEVLMVIHPPEIEGTDEERGERRRRLTTAIKDFLSGALLENCDHLIVPQLEIEVIPQHSSGYGLKPNVTEAYRWRPSAPAGSSFAHSD